MNRVKSNINVVTPNLAEFDRTNRLSKEGYEFSLTSYKWKLSKDVGFKLDWSEKLSPILKKGFIYTMGYFAENQSPFTTDGYGIRLKSFFDQISYGEITPVSLINFKSSNDENVVGVVRTFLRRWHDLGYDGISEEVIRLLSSWTLKGIVKGKPVSSLDPIKGPFSDIEFAAIQEQLPVGFSEGLYNANDYAQTLISLNTGRRPIQISNLKAGDMFTAQSKEGVTLYYLNIPRAKQGGIWRESFKRTPITEDLWTVINITLNDTLTRLELDFSLNLTKKQIQLLPLFPSEIFWDELIDDLGCLDDISSHQRSHIPSSQITKTIKRVIESLKITSERTGKLLIANGYRFRYTTGTRAAREGFGEIIIAEILDHSDTQHAGVYTKNVPEIAKHISDIMNALMLTYAQAFAGTIIKNEGEAQRSGDRTSLIRTHGSEIGSCGSYGFCSAMAPVACYTCNKFQPWLEAPHTEILKMLVEQRERIKEVTGELTIAAINDRSIIAVAQVIKLCEERKQELKNG